MSTAVQDPIAASTGLDTLWNPRSVAIIGASDNPARFGGRPIQFLLQSGFAGQVYPVNPARTTVQGLPAFPSVGAIGAPVDCAIISVPTDSVIDEIAACAAHGVRSAIIFSAGFAELGQSGEALQQQIVYIARPAGMRVLGPNCMGLFNARNGFCPTFASTLEDGLPIAGNVGLVSQSGGYGGYVLRHFKMRDIALSYWITTGNEADIDAGEVLHWMAENDDIKVIVAHIEGLRSSAHFLAALKIARDRRKPVIMMKVGRTAEGSEAAKSHTASLTGADAVYDCVLNEYGVYRARTTEELVDVAYAASKGCYPAGDRVGIISISGGVGVQMADYVAEGGLQLAATPATTQEQLRALIPACSPRNPIDLTGLVTADRHLLRDAVEIVLQSRAFDAVIIFIGITAMAPSMGDAIRNAIFEGSKDYPDQLLLVSLTAPEPMQRAFEDNGFVVFEDPSRAVNALAALARLRDKFDEPPDEWSTDAPSLQPLPVRGRLNEVEAKALLSFYGIKSPREVIVRTAKEAADAAEELGCPVAIKVVSPDIAHKSDIGGVTLGVRDPAGAAAAFTQMEQSVKRACPDATVEGFLISPMVQGGVEMLLGVRRDPVFGPVVAIGLGGVFVELFNDVQMHLAPVSNVTARKMLERLKSFPLLNGYRGREPADVESLVQAISDFSRMAMSLDPAVRSFEINPLVVLDRGKGSVALDAAVETDH